MMYRYKMILIVLISVAIFEVYSLPESGYRLNTMFSVTLNNFPLRNIEFDEQASSYYVSGKNVLYKFDLGRSGPTVTKVTGPNNTCFIDPYYREKYCGDDENSVMVVTPNSLITCSTLYGGKCIKREKSTLNEDKTSGGYTNFHLVPNTTLSALGQLVNINITLRGSKQLKQLILFAKPPSDSTPFALPRFDRILIFSTHAELQHRSFPTDLTTENIFDMYLKEIYHNNAKMKINYKAIFQNDDFVFILFNQNSLAKLAKMCKTIDKESPKRVYEDIPIYCEDESEIFTTVVHGKFVILTGTRYLVAAFSNSAGKFALCVFSEIKLYDAFLKSRQHRFGCPKHDLQSAEMIFDGIGYKNLPRCINMSLEKNEELLPDGMYDAVDRGDFCNDVVNAVPQFGTIIGLLPLTGIAVYKTHTRITMIGDHEDNGFVLLYLGTDHGSILKTYIDETIKVHFIEEIKIDFTRIKSIININGEPVVMTENKIVNITSAGCDGFDGSCKDCMRAKSAQCGWCITTQRCTRRLECNSESNLWLPSLKNHCLNIHLDEDSVEIDSHQDTIYKQKEKDASKNNLTVNFIPPITTTMDLTCLIYGIYVITYHERVSLKCEIDFTRTSPTVEPGEKQLRVLLEGRVIAETMVLFYRCTDMKSCWKCLENKRMTCYWCSFDVTCSKSRGDCSSQIEGGTNSTKLCPVVVSSIKLISSGGIKNLTFQGQNLKRELTYQCLVNEKTYQASLNITTNYLVCQDIMISYSEKVPTKEFHIVFKYGPNLPTRILDSFGNETFISVYKCEFLSPDKRDCSRCEYLKLSEDYNCAWCGKKNGCVQSEKCLVPKTCPPPEIEKIDPSDGPIGGGTLIRIVGRNLGASVEEVQNVTVAGVECSNVQFLQTSLTCLTGKVSGPISGNVMVLVSRLWSNESVKFAYKAPEITGIYPASLIKSGGRSIRITGQNINIGNRNYEVILSPFGSGRNKTCAIENHASTDGEIVCIPEETDVLLEHIVRVVFDSNTKVNLKNKFLTYIANPSVTGTTPIELKSIKSGGLGFLVHGKGFVDVIENIFTSFSESIIEGPKCSRQSTVLLSCKYPKIQENEPLHARKKRSILATSRTIVLHIDGFKCVISSLVLYVSDPVFFAFNGNQSYEYEPSSKKRNISIKGIQMNVVTDLTDYSVQIGRRECVVLQLLNDTLVFLPPYDQPAPLLNEDKLYIRVTVGNIHTVVGVVHYSTRETTTSYSNNTLYIVMACLLSLFFIVCAAFILIRQRKEDCFKTKSTNRTGIPMENVQRVSGYDILVREGYDNPDTTTIFANHVNENILLLLHNKGLLISKDNLEINVQIGKGNFGVVYEGSLTNTEEDSKIKVAVKTLHQSNPREIDVDNFLDEAIRMHEFNHPNVMILIGICLSLDEMPLVVLPYMKHGDLLCYIREDKNMLTLRNLLEFATDISKGMEYLSIHRVVHRDLAARNCMLNECYRAVVADFGLSRDIYEKDYYSSSNKKTRLPVKWMAPESLEKGIYSSQSDVWSFGVTMWELLTRGSKPYPEVDGWDMLKYLKNSRRLPKPAKCPQLLYTKMLSCWNLHPDERPTFSDLVVELSEIVSPTVDVLETHSDYQSLQNTYINTGIEGYLELEK